MPGMTWNSTCTGPSSAALAPMSILGTSALPKRKERVSRPGRGPPTGTKAHDQHPGHIFFQGMGAYPTEEASGSGPDA